MTTTARRVGIVGGGIIGLSIAFEAARRGHEVSVIDRTQQGWATWAAAGILAPGTASAGADPVRIALQTASLRRYPEFVGAVETATGIDVGFRRCGSVVVGSSLEAFASELDAGGTMHRFVEGEELRGLAPGAVARTALFVPDDALIDTRRLHAALGKAVMERGTIVNAWASGIAPGEVALDDGRTLAFDEVVVTAGAWVNRLLARPEVTPVKGQTIIVESDVLLTDACLLGLDTDPPLYLARRSENRYVVAATVEDAGFDPRVTAGAVRSLLAAAESLVPAIGDAELIDVSAGLRPGAAAPTIGRVGDVLVAAGHHRNGILLAPITAAAIADLIEGKPPLSEVAALG